MCDWFMSVYITTIKYMYMTNQDAAPKVMASNFDRIKAILKVDLIFLTGLKHKGKMYAATQVFSTVLAVFLSD